ncbi:MAG TPA: hypothetical protein PLY93_00620 [Turneriella sp.]|nr:hypothetical protein [Turneriella sp.]
MKKILSTIFFVLSVGTLFADSARPEILDRIRDYDLRHTDLLVKIVRDSETLRYAKVRALEKIAILYRQSKTEAEAVTPRLFEGIQAGLAHKAPDVREAACNASVVFNESKIAPLLTNALAKTLKEETQPTVLYACAHTMRVFTKDTEAAVLAPALLAQVNRYLVTLLDDSKNEKALREICLALGAAKDRKSFISLLKILQSRYDESVKDAAQEALQAIRVPERK